jgi:hypothetical protein
MRIVSFQNSDGSYGFVRNNTLGLTGDLSIDQNIGSYGGNSRCFLSRILSNNGSGGDRISCCSCHFKTHATILWSLQYKVDNESNGFVMPKQKLLLSPLREVIDGAITYYFNLLLAKENLGTAKTRTDKTDTFMK